MKATTENLSSEILGLNASQDAAPAFAYVPPLAERKPGKGCGRGGALRRSGAVLRDRQIDLDAWVDTEQRAKRSLPACDGNCNQGRNYSCARVSLGYAAAIVDVALLLGAVFSFAAIMTFLGGGA